MTWTAPEAWHRVCHARRDLDRAEALLEALVWVPGDDQARWGSALQALRDLRALHGLGCPTDPATPGMGAIVRLDPLAGLET